MVVFVRKCENSVFISPQKNKVEIELRFFVNLEGVLPVVREKVKNKTVATFYDVYDVFDPDFGSFFNFLSGLKVIWLFKAKMGVFRERNREKVEKGPFFLIRQSSGNSPAR